jgi:type I thyroxine 5'-deiodinase
VQFISIYIREAHPVDGWWFGGGIQEKIVKTKYPKVSTDLYDPKTIEERRAAAGQCEESLQYGIRTFVDEMDDPVNKAYAALPTRLYLVGIDGNIAYAGGPGPWGFKPEELKEAIEEYLAGAH